MTIIIIFILVIFSVAGVMGFLLHRSPIWNLVDVAYYPLAAVSVVLVFASNTADRKIFELEQLISKHQSQIYDINTHKPTLQAMSNNELIEASFHIVDSIVSLDTACSMTTARNPRCLIAERLKPSVYNFLKTTRIQYNSPELRLFGVCSAIDHFLVDMRDKVQISPLIGDEIIAQYQSVFAKGYQPFDYGIVVAEALGFEQRALGRVERLRQTMDQYAEENQAGLRHVSLYDNEQSARLMLSIHKAEIDFGKLLLQRLYPCFVSPKQDFELLGKWHYTQQIEQQKIEHLEQNQRQIKQSNAVNPLVLWLNLSLWPIVLIFALSLKFAKGVAIARMANAVINRRRNI